MAKGLIERIGLQSGPISGNGDGSSLSIPSENLLDFLGTVVVSALGAGTTLTLKIQHSPDGGTSWIDLAAFSAITGTGAFKIAVSDPVLPKVRATWSFSGGTTTATIDCALWAGVTK